MIGAAEPLDLAARRRAYSRRVVPTHIKEGAEHGVFAADNHDWLAAYLGRDELADPLDVRGAAHGLPIAPKDGAALQLSDARIRIKSARQGIRFIERGLVIEGREQADGERAPEDARSSAQGQRTAAC